MMDYWAVLNYEIQMYLGARLLQGFPIQGVNKNIIILQTSAMTEVKALHTRILVDIFLPRKQKTILILTIFCLIGEKKNKIAIHNLENAYDKKLDIGHSPKWYLNKYLVHPDKRRGDHFNWAPLIERMDPPLKNIFTTLPLEKLEALKFFEKYIYQ